MLQRGRKSAEQLSVVPIMPGSRPDPLPELTEEQAVEWRAIVGRMAPGWFTPETLPILGQLCRHIVCSREVGAELSRFKAEWLKDEDGLKRFEKLTRIHEKEGRAMASLATRLRLTPQSRFNDRRAATAASKAPARKPWEEKEEE